MSLPVARTLLRGGDATPPWDLVTLSWDGRMLRRRRLATVHDEPFLVDLPDIATLAQGDRLVLEDGRQVEVIAAEEDLMEVTGPDLVRLAWHIGNRHAPCQIDGDRLLLSRDRILRDMLERLGATVRDVSEPFGPEGGAYGPGRTMGHDHGPGHPHGHEPLAPAARSADHAG